MPRHAFRIPRAIRAAVQRHVDNALTGIPRRGFRQEPSYVAAIAARLVGTAYTGPLGSVVFEATPVDDRGRGTAESWAGADVAITARIRMGRVQIDKAIIAQAKLGAVDRLNTEEQLDLYTQIALMKRLTRSPQIIEIREVDGRREVSVISANRVWAQERYTTMQLGAYMTRRVLPTLDGDTRPDFVEAVRDSSLTQLRVTAILG